MVAVQSSNVYTTLSGVKFARTPDYHFDSLDFEFAPQYLEIEGLRLHYLHENKGGAQQVLLLHGVPTWSYLYRDIVRQLVSQNYEVIAPDYIGFGKSDKPLEKSYYSYDKTLHQMEYFVREVGLTQAHIVMHDWGGLVGLRLLKSCQNLFISATAMNTSFPIGGQISKVFAAWKLLSPLLQQIKYSKLMAPFSSIPSSALTGYDAPFPNQCFKAGPLVYPRLVPQSAKSPGMAEHREVWEFIRHFQKPFLTIYSKHDIFSKGANKQFIDHVPGAQAQHHIELNEAKHYLQESHANTVAKELVKFFRASH